MGTLITAFCPDVFVIVVPSLSVVIVLFNPPVFVIVIPSPPVKFNCVLLALIVSAIPPLNEGLPEANDKFVPIVRGCIVPV